MNMNTSVMMMMKPKCCDYNKLKLIGVRSYPFYSSSSSLSSSSYVINYNSRGRRSFIFRSSSTTTIRITRASAHSNNTSPPSDYNNNHNHYYYVPDANFYKIEAILRPWRIPQVSSALLKMGIRGVTVSDVKGFGAQGGLTERQAGSEFSEDKFLAKVKMEIVVSKDQVEAVIDKIITEARTGEIGDGKIFLLPVADVIRVRTGERGENAERMLGGRSDMSSSV